MFGFEYYIPAAAVLAGLKLLAAGTNAGNDRLQRKKERRRKE